MHIFEGRGDLSDGTFRVRGLEVFSEGLFSSEFLFWYNSKLRRKMTFKKLFPNELNGDIWIVHRTSHFQSAYFSGEGEGSPKHIIGYSLCP